MFFIWHSRRCLSPILLQLSSVLGMTRKYVIQLRISCKKVMELNEYAEKKGQVRCEDGTKGR